MKVYLDDLREAPEGWIRVYTAKEAIALLETGNVEEISLDHDLGDEKNCGTGYDVICWIEEKVVTENFTPPRVKVHSANTSARGKMESALAKINNRH